MNHINTGDIRWIQALKYKTDTFRTKLKNAKEKFARAGSEKCA